jgi:hypothetical protein
MKHAQVEREHEKDEEIESDPEPEVISHEGRCLVIRQEVLDLMVLSSSRHLGPMVRDGGIDAAASGKNCRADDEPMLGVEMLRDNRNEQINSSKLAK